jgi:hypothetical protein
MKRALQRTRNQQSSLPTRKIGPIQTLGEMDRAVAAPAIADGHNATSVDANPKIQLCRFLVFWMVARHVDTGITFGVADGSTH